MINRRNKSESVIYVKPIVGESGSQSAYLVVDAKHLKFYVSVIVDILQTVKKVSLSTLVQ